jgi:hypothetical protein
MVRAQRIRKGRSDSASGARRRRLRLVLIAGVVLVVLAAVGVPTIIYTERPQFCPVCHEMGPYYDAWSVGAHKATSCVDCHVDPGVVAHGLHKFVALKEVWDHFTKDNRFPNYAVDLPNARCTACHPTVPDALGAKFSHKLHAAKSSCKECHATTGHQVTIDALAVAGILKTGATPPPNPPGTPASAVPGHKTVSCQRCHDQAKMKCADCHKAPHDPKPGDCSECHRPGDRFVYSHPADAGCARCHKPPPNHYGPVCARCHTSTVPFARAVFKHVGNTGEHSYRSFPCAKCHPKGYGSASCTCHGGRPPSGD